MKKNRSEYNPSPESSPGSGQESANENITTEAAEKTPAVESETAKPNLEEELQEQKDKYLRLYAEFENYKKRMLKDKEELIKYGNESLLYELLPVIDNLEMAMKHSSNDISIGDQPKVSGLVQGVEITLKEFIKVLDRFGLSQITALNKTFDPSIHHAMAQVERDDVDENTVVEEFRKGYMFKDKVLRPSLVVVSKKSAVSSQSTRRGETTEAAVASQEEKEEEITINEISEEE